MPRRRIPSYRRHQSGQATVRLGGRDYYLGKHGTAESRSEYDRLIAEWLAGGEHLPERPAGRTVNELILAYVKGHVETYYVKDGRPTSQQNKRRTALGHLRVLYGATAAAGLTPVGLQAVRGRMVAEGLARPTVNEYVWMVVDCFRWGAEQGLVPPAVWHALRCVKPLARGRTPARDYPKVPPAPGPDVEAAVGVMREPSRTMALLQRLTGMRPGEVRPLKGSDIDRSAVPWVYRPPEHKTEHLEDKPGERSRWIFFGPKARELLAPYLAEHGGGFLFALRDRGPLRNRHRRPISYRAYVRHVEQACQAAGVPKWCPNQLRHAAGTEARRRAGREGAQQMLGHDDPRTTDIYAEPDREIARRLAEEMG